MVKHIFTYANQMVKQSLETRERLKNGKTKKSISE